MHLETILAFAALLWFTSSNRSMNLLELSHGQSLLFVVGQFLLIAGGSLLFTRITLRTLKKHPDEPNRAQHVHHLGTTILQWSMLAFFVGALILTSWPAFVRTELGTGRVVGLSDFVTLAPFLINVVVLWIAQFPSDRAIRKLAHNPRIERNQPVHAVWSFGEYLMFNFRFQLLTVAAPMGIIIVADDWISRNRTMLREWAGVQWMPDATMGIVVTCIFVFAPVMMRYILHTQPLPPGELRDRLAKIAEQMDLRCRNILIWQSRGMIINAAIMGIIPQVRYVLISDGLLESMSDRHIEAVFGHEAGHVKYWHIPFFVVFAILTMMIGGGLMLLLHELARTDTIAWLTRDHIHITVGVVMAAMWLLVFGWISHQFEYQADISGAASITRPDDNPGVEYVDDKSRQRLPRLGIEAAEQFGEALMRVARLNGIPTDERDWRHPTIEHRIEFLREMGQDPIKLHAFMKHVWWVKAVLFGGTIIALALGAWLLWDQLLPISWRAS